jgi:hypothetical protein
MSLALARALLVDIAREMEHEGRLAEAEIAARRGELLSDWPLDMPEQEPDSTAP